MYPSHVFYVTRKHCPWGRMWRCMTTSYIPIASMHIVTMLTIHCVKITVFINGVEAPYLLLLAKYCNPRLSSFSPSTPYIGRLGPQNKLHEQHLGAQTEKKKSYTLRCNLQCIPTKSRLEKIKTKFLLGFLPGQHSEQIHRPEVQEKMPRKPENSWITFQAAFIVEVPYALQEAICYLKDHVQGGKGGNKIKVLISKQKIIHSLGPFKHFAHDISS